MSQAQDRVASTPVAESESASESHSGESPSTEALWVVVPAFNEANRILGALRALSEQDDRDFRVVVVDNGSTDGTAAIVRRFAATAPIAIEVIVDNERGAGAAADTGFRHAIARGASAMLRTDADCLPAPDWVARGRAALRAGAELVCGRSIPRLDERPNVLERRVLPAVTRGLALYGRYRRAHRDPRFRTPYVLCHGHNLAITAGLYLRCGGAPREPLQAGAEDVTLLNRAREHSDRVVRDESMVVQNSLRRLRAWGVRRTLLWHWDRRYVPHHESEVHVR
jgi:glycosyltransferase involved in cell wall biosynthesis